MNTPITRLYIVFLLLFGVLVVGTSWNTVFRADELRDKPQNRRQLLEQQRIRRGTIRAADGSVLARSVRRSDDTFTRLYPDAAIIFDNLHSLHDVVSDVLASRVVAPNAKRRTILQALARYRDDRSSTTSRNEWLEMSRAMGGVDTTSLDAGDAVDRCASR